MQTGVAVFVAPGKVPSTGPGPGDIDRRRAGGSGRGGGGGESGDQGLGLSRGGGPGVPQKAGLRKTVRLAVSTSMTLRETTIGRAVEPQDK